MKTLFACWFLGWGAALAAAVLPVPPPANLTVSEISYAGRLTDEEARFTLNVFAEAVGPAGASQKLLEGDIAVLPATLPGALQLYREGSSYYLRAERPGRYQFKLELVAKIHHEELWNQVTFTGPPATIAAVTVQATGTNTEVQLLTGTVLENYRTPDGSGVRGYLGAEQGVSLRWQGKVTAVARPALLTVESSITAEVNPTLLKYTSQFRYDIVQGAAKQLEWQLPANQTLTKLDGQQIRDWHLVPEGDHQRLTVEFIKPVETSGSLTLYSEATAGKGTAVFALNPPQPLGVERESGALTITAMDTMVEVVAQTGLRQVNAPDNAVVAYRYNSRPFELALSLKPVTPVITVADRINARLEETRWLVTHALELNIDKAGVYGVELLPPPGMVVAEVRGNGVDDWKLNGNRLQLNFAQRVLGARHLEIQLEQSLKTFPATIPLEPLPVIGAVRETAQVAVGAVAGIRLKTDTLTAMREIPVNQLSARGDATLGYVADQAGWSLRIGSEKLAARVVADVFNLVTIGDGLIGGSATLRYGFANQGVQEFKVRIPAAFKNVEFTGANIRRKEQAGEIWTIRLQDKVWSGYTLVVTYDSPFDGKGATLPLAGIHAVEVERETGSIAVTTAASLQLEARTVSDGLHRVDEGELSAADRALIRLP